MLKPLLATAFALHAGAAHAAAPACEAGPALKLDGPTACIVLVGETHGTGQAPAFLARLQPQAA